MKLETLDKKQIKIMEQTRQEWLDRFFSGKLRTDRKQATESIKWLYKFSKLKEPRIIFLSSPLGIQFGANMLKGVAGAQVGAQVRAQVRDQVWAQVWAQVGAQVGDQVRDQVGAQVRDQVWAQVWAQVRDQVWAQVRDQVGDQKLEWFSTSYSYYGSIWDYGWVSFYDFFTRIGVIDFEPFNNFMALMKSGVYEMILLDGLCIVSDMPIKVYRDERNRLHNENGPAIEFADGYKLWFYHGIAIKPEWIENPSKLTKKDWGEESNLEKRRIIQELMGNTFPKKIGSKLIAKPSKEFKQEHNLFGLYEVELPNDPEERARYIKVQDHSSKRQYFIRVKPDIDNADEALGWTFGLTKETYAPIQEA
jgi:hypothetical protein